MIKVLKSMVLKTFIAATVLLTSGTSVVSAAPDNKTADAWIYYTKGDSGYNLWRVKSDGSSQPELASKNFDGTLGGGDRLVPAGDYFFYQENPEKSGSLFRISNSKIANAQRTLGILNSDTCVNFTSDGKNIYYLNDKGNIMVYPANSKSIQTEVKPFQNNAFKEIYQYHDDDGNLRAALPTMFISNNRLYFNIIKDRAVWVASKSLNADGAVSLIAKGMLDNKYFTQIYNGNMYLMINTNPAETEKSTDSIVMYQVPLAGGVGKAINAKAPLDYNSAYSGIWLDKYFLFNNDKGASVLTTNGAVIKIHDKPVYEAQTSVVANKYIFTDESKTYKIDIANGKAANKTNLNVDKIYGVRSLKNLDNTIRKTALFGENGTYTVGADFKAKKLVGVEWDYCRWQDGVNGIFFINNNDSGKLYRANEDGSGTKKVTDDTIKQIVYILPIK